MICIPKREDHMESIPKVLVLLASDIPMLRRSLRAVASGELWVSRQIVAKLIQHIQRSKSRSFAEVDMIAPLIAVEKSRCTLSHPQPIRPLNRHGLTQRELQVVRAVGDA